MCCFSGKVEHVADTKIFARNAGRGRQYLVYEMEFESTADVAMILPLPIPLKSMEGDVRFINLAEYKDFFRDLESGFPQPRAKESGNFGGGGFGGGQPKLAVVDVGEFEASFVPTVRDFDRLDERFKLPSDVWLKELPQYRDWGFAVFKLKANSRHVHPMAFEFPRRKPDQLFFPTVHIHDGQVHDVAEYDHALYLQITGPQPAKFFGWRESPRPAANFMKVAKSQSVISGSAHVHRLEIKGEQKNRDVLV